MSFFSGHVAALVICANHMYLHRFKNLGIFMHGFNYMQIIHLLATRVHYSIDITIGWYMATSMFPIQQGGLEGTFPGRDDLKSFEAYMMPTDCYGSVRGSDWR